MVIFRGFSLIIDELPTENSPLILPDGFGFYIPTFGWCLRVKKTVCTCLHWPTRTTSSYMILGRIIANLALWLLREIIWDCWGSKSMYNSHVRSTMYNHGFKSDNLNSTFSAHFRLVAIWATSNILGSWSPARCSCLIHSIPWWCHHLRKMTNFETKPLCHNIVTQCWTSIYIYIYVYPITCHCIPISQWISYFHGVPLTVDSGHAETSMVTGLQLR